MSDLLDTVLANSTILKKTKRGNLLFAICFEYRVRPGQWSTGIDYLHAADAGDARVQYLASEPSAVHKHIRIVGIAPVIGYHAQDDNGDSLKV